jgi:hypothetical protein
MRRKESTMDSETVVLEAKDLTKHYAVRRTGRTA